MFNFVFNKDLGSGYLFLVNQAFTKSDLDLITTSIASLKSDSRSLAYCSFADLTLTSKSRALYTSGSPNSQVPRYGQVYYPTITGLGSMVQLRSGNIAGGIIVIGDPVTKSAFLSYGVGAEIVGSHASIAMGSPAPTITFNQNVTYT
jgi:hypothetical protein